MTLYKMLEKAARQYSGKTAIVMGERRITYAELEQASCKMAAALQKMGVKKGDRVAIIAGNTPEFIVTFFGIEKIGGVAVALDNRYKIPELVSILDNCRPRVIAAESPFIGPVAAALPQFKSVEYLIDLSGELKGKFLTCGEIMSQSPVLVTDVEIKPADLAAISYSGGPTINPHGAALTHHSLVLQAGLSGDSFRQTDKDVVMLFALPMYHMYGLSAVLLTSINRGSTIAIVSGTGISIRTLLAEIERERGTILHAVPYIYALAIQSAKKEGIQNDLSSLRLCASGGAHISASTIRQFKQYYGLTVADIYGLTEAVCQVSCSPIDGTGKLGAAGKAMPGWEIKVVDDTGKEMTTNHCGEVVVRGHFMSGYYNNPRATAEAVKNGWLHTGDIGRIDKDGYLFITGRKKHMIILKGQNVYPSDIEAVLLTCPAIAAVKVIGVEDRLRGEVVRAFITLKKGEKATEHDIRRFCQDIMADYKVPRQIIFTETIPEEETVKGKRRLKEYLPKLMPLSYMQSSGKGKRNQGS